MAYIGKVSIRDNSHMANAIDYISREEKALTLDEFKSALNDRLLHLQGIDANSGERATCINCTAQNTYKDFENMRRAFGQDRGVIAHHYYQSFQKDDNVTAEVAHQIGVELAKKMFPDFQVVVATHVDREHVHNHLIVNSCNITTGQKWYSNKKSLSDIRKESDKLCLQHGLGIIQRNSRYKGIDRTTYQLGMKGKSWKINLLKDLDGAVQCCRSKDEFIRYLTERDYTVRYRDMHITITKNGEKKGIRVDTLAKQFGEKYRKENLERAMGYYVPPPPDFLEQYQSRVKPESTTTDKSNWEHFAEWTFRHQNCYSSTPEHITRPSRTEQLFNAAETANSTRAFPLVFRAILFLISLSGRRRYRQRFRMQSRKNTEHLSRTFHYGNVNPATLMESAGENFTIKVSMEYFLKLINQPLLYNVEIDRETATATITVKARDKDFLSQILELDKMQKKLEQQNTKLANQKMYKRLKQTAELREEKLQYIMVTPEQKKVLEEHFIEFAYFEKEDKFNIAFLPETMEIIKALLHNKQQAPKETAQQRNSRIYAGLKKNAAQNGERLCYRTKLTADQLKVLNKLGITFAYFTNSEDKSLYNIAFEKKNEETVKAALTSSPMQKK